jgi:protein SCO1/2
MKNPTISGIYARFAALAIVAIISLAASWTVAQPAFKDHPEQQAGGNAHTLPVYGSLSAFSFQAQDGKPLSSDTLAGKVWIADFIYTTCTDECPLMTAEMARLQQKIASHQPVMLVSFTVDPENDTPAVLQQYANRFQVQSERWKFLTGPRKDLYQLAQKNFHLPVQAIAPAPDTDHAHHKSRQTARPFLHSQKFVLVDQHLQIRGYYDSTDPDAIKKLLETDLPSLLSAS